MTIDYNASMDNMNDDVFDDVDALSNDSIDKALEKCATCTKAMFPTKVFEDRFKEEYAPLLKSGEITQRQYDTEHDTQFDEVIEKGALYFCGNCDNVLYKKD